LLLVVVNAVVLDVAVDMGLFTVLPIKEVSKRVVVSASMNMVTTVKAGLQHPMGTI
jgi:hypothetical protein